MDAASNNYREVVQTLSQIRPAELPLDVFTQVARVTVTPVLEVVPVFVDESSATMKIMLFKRPESDPVWAGKYCLPGSIVLATDKSQSLVEAQQRVLNKLELYRPSRLEFVHFQLTATKRGTELALIYKTTLRLPPPDDLLFLATSLPRDLVEGHGDFIEAATI